jgi:hypothetical protein
MPIPWPKGKHHDYVAFVVEVHVRKDRDGTVRSVKRLQDEQDERTTANMEGSHGMQEGGWALLTEAVRSEAMLQLLVKISNDPEFKEKLLSGDDVVTENLLNNLKKDTLEQLKKSLDEVTPHLVREATETVRDGLAKAG